MDTIVSAPTLPSCPAATAWAAAFTHRLPAGSTASSVVSKRTSAAVIHTVPLGMTRLAWAVLSTENRTVPCARAAARRSSPRRAACISRCSPAAVWGKHCRAVHRLWVSSA